MVVRQVLITKNWDALAGLFENLDDLLKKLVTRVQNLAKLVYRIVAVLDDQGDRIDIEPRGSTQRLSRGLDQLDAVALAKTRPQVVGRRLIVVHPHDLQVRLVREAVLLKTENHPPHDVIGVRAETKDRINRGNPLRALRCWPLLSVAASHAPQRRGDRRRKSGGKQRSARYLRNGRNRPAIHIVGLRWAPTWYWDKNISQPPCRSNASRKFRGSRLPWPPHRHTMPPTPRRFPPQDPSLASRCPPPA